MHSRTTRSVSLACGIAWSLLAAAASAAPMVEDFQIWGAVTATGSLGGLNPAWKQWKFWLEGQGRFGNDTTTASQGMLRPGLGYALTDKASLWLGYGSIPTMEPFAAVDFNEQRIWQQFLWSETMSLGAFQSRTRFEERFINQGEAAYRFRQLFKISHPLAFAPNWSLVGWDEMFVHLSDTFRTAAGFDQNRLFGGLGYAFDKELKLEVGYMNQLIHREDNGERMDHNIAISLFLNY
jgi:hypothetical protein